MIVKGNGDTKSTANTLRVAVNTSHRNFPNLPGIELVGVDCDDNSTEVAIEMTPSQAMYHGQQLIDAAAKVSQPGGGE